MGWGSYLSRTHWCLVSKLSTYWEGCWELRRGRRENVKQKQSKTETGGTSYLVKSSWKSVNQTNEMGQMGVWRGEGGTHCGVREAEECSVSPGTDPYETSIKIFNRFILSRMPEKRIPAGHTNSQQPCLSEVSTWLQQVWEYILYRGSTAERQRQTPSRWLHLNTWIQPYLNSPITRNNKWPFWTKLARVWFFSLATGRVTNRFF